MKITGFIRRLSKNEKLVFTMTAIYNRFNLKNRIKGKRNNKVNIKGAMLNNVKIDFRGKGNLVKIDKFSRLNNVKIIIDGNDNIIELNERVSVNGACFVQEDDCNEIRIGRHVNIAGAGEYATIEGTKILIGEDCLISSQIDMRTGDSHSMVNLDGERINPSKDIVIGNHVWITRGCSFLKGAEVSNNCIIGAQSMVTKKFDKENVVIAGHPAKIIKENINWENERKPC